MMLDSVLLLMAAAASQPMPAAERTQTIRPTVTISARATARITVLSGVMFGADHAAKPAGADRRSALLTDQDGQVRPAELLEFQ